MLMHALTQLPNFFLLCCVLNPTNPTAVCAAANRGLAAGSHTAGDQVSVHTCSVASTRLAHQKKDMCCQAQIPYKRVLGLLAFVQCARSSLQAVLTFARLAVTHDICRAHAALSLRKALCSAKASAGPLTVKGSVVSSHRWFNHTTIKALPKCRFTVSDRCGGIPAAAAGGGGPSGLAYKWLIVGPQCWTHKTNTRYHYGLKMTRVQLPLLHAWAITVHKSQVCFADVQ